MTKSEAIDRAVAAIQRAEEATTSEQRQDALNVADRWINLVIHGFNADRSPVGA